MQQSTTFHVIDVCEIEELKLLGRIVVHCRRRVGGRGGGGGGDDGGGGGP